jgi:hypothetical protein
MFVLEAKEGAGAVQTDPAAFLPAALRDQLLRRQSFTVVEKKALQFTALSQHSPFLLMLCTAARRDSASR